MIVENPEQYTLSKFIKANDGKHKYFAILINKQTKREKKVPFGAIGYEQYKDKIGSYKSSNHLDKKRRDAYRARHQGEQNNKFSSGYFSWKYLWT